MIKTFRRLKSRHAPKGSFSSHVLTLMTGTTIAQAVPIAISPILTRLYAPEDFGLFALYMSVSGLMSVLATGRYELAIMLPEKDEDAVNIVALSVVIAFFISMATLLIVFVFNKQIGTFLRNTSISSWLYFIPLTVLLTGIYQATGSWLTRKQHYKVIAGSRISQSASIASTNLTMGFCGLGSAGLILGDMAGQGVVTGVTAIYAMREGKESFKFISKKRMSELASRYSDFPKINLLHAIGDILQASGVVFLISFFFSPVILGHYSFGMRILRAPLSLIGASVSQVFYQKAAAMYYEGKDLQPLVKAMMKRLALIALPIFGTMIIFGPSIFAIIFGEKWREAGVYTQILSPWLFLNFIASPISQIPVIVNKQRQIFIISLIGNSSMLMIILYAGYCSHDLKAGFYILSCFMTIYMISVIFWTLKIAGKRLSCV